MPFLLSARPLRCAVSILLLALAVPSLAFASMRGPEARDYGKFAAFDSEATAKPNYTPMDQFLQAFAERRGVRTRLTYDRMGVEGLAVLKKYMMYLEQVPVTRLARVHQLAYWLNLHNWMVIEGLLEREVGRKIDDERGTPDEPGGLWTLKRVVVEGVLISIRDIEEKIVFAHWDDPLVLYGLYQGAWGGPGLNPTAFDGDTVFLELETLGRAFVASKDHVKPSGRTLRVAEFYDWFKDEAFGGDDKRLIAHVKSLAPPKRAEDFAEVSRLRIIDFDYAKDQLILKKPQLGRRGGIPRAPR
ncbi:MAG: DUF547 domain-containing protein [Alphaproteobacteria bacterium]